ncbi:deoxyribodipyrimidine photo-lyase [Lentzea xinjiangensis]|uniref:Deoxyribodipyrimidine photo-lyase n=1 Tax=Lentzea xinjiangensis TaxID=402600 RepID=A0A1H9E9R9_9PSEU|nr:deoxyribodipyrimidine photo-lyase [Lentzea xinjiangensis]SEQ22385.1 deoxyribodipyrimidine photo-lyase [Lentzea xinjiangensis]
MSSEPSLVWFRRDLRTSDHPAILAAAERSPRALALFVLDDRLLKPSGQPRIDFLHRCLHALNDELGGRLMVVHGDPVEVVPRVAAGIGAHSVHISADYAPYGRRRDEAVEEALGDIELVRSGSPYAVAPGRVFKQDGTPFKVFTPFRNAWLNHGWREPAGTDASTLDWIEPDGGVEIPAVREKLPDALALWEKFRDERLGDYDRTRDRPDLDATSRMSAFLRWGVLHPRTLLQDCDGMYRSELAWREFYADVLWHRPETARQNYDRKFDRMRHDEDQELFEAWKQGRTGFPIVDAGMRQLLREGFMHNRVRMITASFLVKDLHLPWWWGARHFMEHLIDGDLASNQHNWQWVAGCGTDAAPFFRVFNPVTQARKFDPDGAYVRRYAPDSPDIPPIVDHAVERLVALDRYQAVKA